MVTFLLSSIVVIILLALVVSRLRHEQSGHAEEPPPLSNSADLSPEPEPARPKKAGPPSAGQGLEALRARLADMPTEDLREMLDMGAHLKPGAEDLIVQELGRRRGDD